MNAAVAADSVAITIAPGAAIQRPDHIVLAAASHKPKAINTRSLIVIGADREQRGTRPTGVSGDPVLQLVFGKDPRVEHIKVLRERRHGLHLGTLLVNLKRYGLRT